MKRVHKEYSHSFLLEPTKLTRLIGVIHERLGDYPDTVIADRFDVLMKGNRHDETDTLEGVLAIENSKKYRVERLIIVASATRAGTSQAEVRVDFGVSKNEKSDRVDFAVSKIQKKSGEPEYITVDVQSDDAHWNSTMLSEVEEQVERTEHKVSPVLLAGVVVVAFFILGLLASELGRFPEYRDLSNVAWLDDGSLDRVEKAVKENRTMTEEEVREVISRQYRNVLFFKRPPTPPPKGVKRRTVLIGIPVLVVAACFVLLVNCYPRKVFLWGDEVERYSNLVHRRRLIWQVIIGVMVIGVLGKFFSEGILSSLPIE